MTHIRTYPTTQTGVDEDGLPIMEAVSGIHIDTLEAIEGADAFLVTPATPQHGFAGVPLDQVYRYRFPTEADYQPFAPVQDADALSD